MALNSISPTTFTSGVLITDTTKVTNGSPDAIINKITPGTALDVQSVLGGICFPRMNSTQIAALPNNPGMSAYNTTTNSFVNWANGGPIPVYPVPIITNGTNDLFIGFNTGNVAALLTSGDNVFVGMDCGSTLLNGNRNTALGLGTMDSLTNGNGNTAVGFACMDVLIQGNNNTAGGSNCLGTAGAVLTNCTAFGSGAGQNFNNLTAVTLLGYHATVDANGRTNSMALGANAVVGADNACVIGDGTVSVGIGISVPTSKLHVVSTDNAIHCDGAFVGRVRENNANAVTIAANDYIYAQNGGTAPITITLPAITNSNIGTIYTIKDIAPIAATHAITITATGGKTIDGAATLTSSTDFCLLSVFNNGTQWFILNKIGTFT